MAATTALTELTTEQVSSMLVQPLEAASVVLRAGPRIFDTSEPLRIPKLTGSDAPDWIGEGVQITEADLTFDEITLLPTTLKSVKVISRYTNELARQSVVGIDSTIRARLVRDVADKLDTAFLTGDGASDTVTGLAEQSGISTGDLDVTDIDSLHDAVATFFADEIDPLGGTWFFSPADFVAIRKIKDLSDRYILEPDVTRQSGYRLLGMPVVVTNKLTADTALLVAMDYVAVARDLAPSVKILDQLYADYDMVGIRVVTRYDLGLLHPEAVVLLTTPAP